MEETAKRLQETVRHSSEDSTLLVPVADSDIPQTVPVLSKICSIITSHLSNFPTSFKGQGCSTNNRNFCKYCFKNISTTELSETYPSLNKNQLCSACSTSLLSSQAMSGEEQDEPGIPDEGQETSLGHVTRETFLKEFIAEHESQVVLWEQMTSFRREYVEMRSHVESLLAHLHMDFTSVAREASCNFVLLMSQMGCPSCTTGAGLEACCEHVKRVEGDLERTDIEKRSLSTKLESLVQLKSQLQEKLDDRENIIQSLTETIDQLQNHCRSLEEKSSDAVQCQALNSSLEKTLRSIGRLVVEDSEICGSQPVGPTFPEDSVVGNLVSLPLLADSTLTAVRAALSRRKTEIQQLQKIISDTEQKVLESEQHQGDSESRERFLQKETLELRTQLALLLGEKQQLLENSKHSEQVANDTMLKLDEKEGTIRHLKEELERERKDRRQLEEKLTDLQHDEQLHRSSHSELLTEYQQLTCDNQLCRSNLSAFEEKLMRLEKEMSQVREERTRLGIALDYSKEEKSKLNEQVKDLTEKTEELRDKLRKSEAEKTVAEESLSRLQYLKTSDEDQLSKLTLENQQSEKERLSLVTDKEELEVELGALKRELVKAEELRMRLESFNATLERSLQTANSDNDDMKEQIEHLIQINDQLTEKQSIMERRCREIETGNNHLLEEISKLSSEFNNTKEREESWRDESTKLKSRIAILEEENETLHQQVMGAQNAHQLTQVSMIATQANYDGIQVELERVTREMQALGEEKELLLIEYQDLHQSTSAMLAQLQNENTQYSRRVTELEERLKKAQQDLVSANAAHEKDMQNLTLKMQQQLSDAEHQYRIELESTRSKYEQELQNMQRELSYQITKLQDEVARVEAAKQNAIALMQAEHQNLQEKLQSCVADLEAERAESSRLRREEVEKQLEHRMAAEALRSEINRLQQELRSTGEARVKDQQMSAQILAVTKENLKKVEDELSAVRGELSSSNRELKDTQRQLESTQLHLNKAESMREEKRKEEMQNRQQLEELRSERDSLRESIIGFQCTIKKFESDRDDLVRCLEEARKRITVLEDNRGVMDQQLAHLRTAVKEAEQQTDRMSKDLSGSQQQLHRTQDQQQRWKERCEVLVEQLQAEQNRAILAEKAAAEHMNKVQALKLHITQMESQFSNKLSQSGAQNTIHQQRIDEMDATVQKALLRSKRLEDERHNFHSRLIETHKEVSLLKQRLRDADSQSQDLTNQLHRAENEKKELSNRLGSFHSTLKRFVRVLEEGQNKPNDFRNSSRFLQDLSMPLDTSMGRSNCPDADAVQTILHDLMRHILQLQSKRTTEHPVQDEPTKLDSQRARSRDRQRLLVRQLRDTEDSAGLRERLSASLNAVASSSSLGTATLMRESTKLDGLVSGVRTSTVPMSTTAFDGGAV